jgi:hypothetical protein
MLDDERQVAKSLSRSLIERLTAPTPERQLMRDTVLA